MHWHRLGELLGRVLPHQRVSQKAIPVADLALGFLAGILAGAQKLTPVAQRRREVLPPELLALARVGRQSSFTRFFQGFDRAGKNWRAFRPLWRGAMERLPGRQGGYSLDVDSTRLLHEDGHQAGGQTGDTRLGNKPCLPPLLAVLEEAKLVAGFWRRVVRADSGFCLAERRDLLEQQGLRSIVVARPLKPWQRWLQQEPLWTARAVPGTDVAAVWPQEINWRSPRRVILIRHHVAEKERPGGKRLVDCPGYLYQAPVTNRPQGVRPLEVWRDYNGRAGCEGVIKQLDADFALPKLCLQKFWGTEAGLSLAVFSCNLCVLFQRHVGWMDRVRAATLRYRLFTTGGIISQTGGVTTIRLAVREESERAWWRRLLEKIQSPVPHCNAVPALPW